MNELGKDDQRKEAVKFDQEKPRYDLIPAKALHELVLVYTMGAKKYAARNWELGMDWSRLFGALLRHTFSWWMGETHDPESGLHHMAHAAFSCLVLVEYHYTKRGNDDRPYVKTNDNSVGFSIYDIDDNGCLMRRPTTETGDNADQRSAQDRSSGNGV